MEVDVSAVSVLLFGLALGVRHAMDADHVVVVSTLVQREPGPWRAARVAALWGAGHTFAFLGVGLLVVLVGLRVPPVFERVAELLVATVLLGVGGLHIVRSLRPEQSSFASTTLVARPIGIGLVHGLAGSAGVALLAASTVESPALAAVYLCVVALGTVFGMVALTVLLSHPIAWTMKQEGWRKKVVGVIGGGLGVALGSWMLLHAVVGDLVL